MSFIYLGKIIISEPFGIIKNVITLIHLAALAVLELLNSAFSSSAREEFIVLFNAFIGSALGLAMRPIAFAVDFFRLSGGALIHPSLAIGAKEID